MNTLDRIIGLISPQWAFNRNAWKQASEIQGQRRYDAAGKGARLKNIDRKNRSAVSETLTDLPTLRGFARKLERDEALVTKALDVRANNIIGAGIRPAITSQNKRTQRELQRIWSAWAETTECDFEENNDIYGLMELVNRTMDRDGEVFIIKRRDKDAVGIPLRLQVLEADFCDDSMNTPTDGGNYVVQGVEFNAKNRRVAYWFYKNNPVGGPNLFVTPEKIRIPKEDVIHLYRTERPGQVRGIPLGVQTFIRLNDLAEYEDAELTRKKIASCFTAFVSTGDPVPVNPNDRERRMKPGSIQYVAQGDKVEIANPPHADGYESYIRANIMRFCAGYGVSYESLGDLGNVNFSSGRMGWIEVGRSYTKTQNRIIIPKFCNRVFGWVQEMAMDFELIKEAAQVTWTPPRREMIDPVKEMEGIILMLSAGLTSWEEEARELGWDPDKLFAMLVANKEKLEKAGIVLAFDPKFKNAGKEEEKEPPKKKAA